MHCSHRHGILIHICNGLQTIFGAISNHHSCIVHQAKTMCCDYTCPSTCILEDHTESLSILSRWYKPNWNGDETLHQLTYLTELWKALEANGSWVTNQLIDCSPYIRYIPTADIIYCIILLEYVKGVSIECGHTVNPEIFGVKIFSDTSKNSKIKNTKIPCSEIIGV